MEQKYKHSDLFLTHTWRADMKGRDNHARVRIVNEELNRLGFATWFDEKSMSGDIKAKMAEGVDFTRCVIVFVTEQYMLKIDSPDEDNCKFEFDRAITQKTDKNVLCVVMEKQFDLSSNWFGKLKETLGDCLYVSMSGDLDDKHYLKQQLQLVVEQLKSKGVVPSQTKNKCDECTITNKNGEHQPLFGDGDACTFCGEDLKKTTDPKNYCVSCNVHSNGSFCQICKIHLLDKTQRIRELKKQLLKVISFELNIDLSKYDVENFKEEIEKMKNELVDILLKRSKAETSDVKLQINETEYNNKVDDLQKKMDDILKNTTHLTTAKEDLQNLEPSYMGKVSQFEEMMNSLEDNRNDLEKRTEQLFRGKDELQKLKKEVKDFAENAVVGEKYHHGKTCSCDDCVFERELTSKIITEGTQECIEQLIKANEIEKIKRAISLKSEIKALKEYGVNLLLSLTFQHGTLEMLIMLLKEEIYIDIERIMFMIMIGSENNPLTKSIVENKIEELQLLIENQKDIVKAKNEHGFNLLLSLAMQHGTVDMFIMLLEMGARVDIDNMGKLVETVGEKNLLRKIINSNKVEDLQSIIKYQKDIMEAKNEDGFNLLLSLTMQHGRADMFIMLLEMGACINIDTMPKLLKTIGENNLVRKIITESEVEDLKKIIELQNDIINAKYENGSNLLLFLTVQDGTLDMFSMLLEMGMEADKINNWHKNLLHYVKNVAIANLLCEKYGDALLKTKDRGGFTPFMLAHHNNDLPMMEAMKPFVNQEEEISHYNYLLTSWKDVPYYDHLQQLEMEGFSYIKELIEKNDIITMKRLITFIPDVVNMTDEKNYTPFLQCCGYGSTDMLKMLVEMGSDVNKYDRLGNIAVMIAVMYNETEWFEEMAEHLCTTQPQPLTTETFNGFSVFHGAASRNREDLIPILLRQSPPPELLEKKNKWGDSPIDVAKRKRYRPIVQMYENYIKDPKENTTTNTPLSQMYENYLKGPKENTTTTTESFLSWL